MDLSSEVIDVLEYLCNKIGVAIDWTSENALPYVTQLCEKFILWEINTSFAWIAIWGVVTIISFILAIVFHKIFEQEDVRVFIWAMFICVFVIFFIVVGVQIFDIIECKTFPEKTIYDYISMKLNNNG